MTTSGNDTNTGTGFSDYLSGNAGADTLIGGTGNDILYGGVGNDCLVGGAGNDWLAPGPGDDTLSFAADWGLDILDFGMGNSNAHASGQNSLVFSGVYYDQLLGLRSGEHMWFLDLEDPNNKVVFLDFFATAGGTNWSVSIPMSGGGTQVLNAATDLNANGVPDVLELATMQLGTASADSMTGTRSGDVNELLWGGAGNDTLTSGGAITLIYGGNGDDSLLSTASGNDNYLFGGTGNDVFSVAAGAYAIINDSEGNLDVLRMSNTALSGPYAAAAIIENRHLILTDTYYGTFVLVWNWVSSRQIDYFAFADTTVTDSYFHANTWAYLPRYEWHHLGIDADEVDSAYAAASRLGGGNGFVNGGIGAVNETVYGLAGADVLAPGPGADTMDGAAGDDIYIVDNAGDVVSDTAGTDTVYSRITYVLPTSIENLRLIGWQSASGGYSDTLDGTGNESANEMVGNDGANRLYGLGGNDTLTGGGGNDSLYGGTGVDTAVFSGRRADYTVETVEGGARVTDNVGLDGVDVLVDMDWLRFADQAILSPSVSPWQFSVADASRTEGNSGGWILRFTVTLDRPADIPLEVSWATAAGGTATAGSDYNTASGLLTFNPGITSRTFEITILGDQVLEPDETVRVLLSGPTAPAVLADAEGIGIIVNDDLPLISIANTQVVEGNSGTSTLLFVVTLTGASQQPVSMNYFAVGDDGRSNGTLVFAPGETSRTIAVQVPGDTIVEPNRTVTVSLSNSVGASGFARSSASGTIIDDDPRSITVQNVSVVEGNAGPTLALVTLVADGNLGEVSVDLSAKGGTAQAGVDYLSADRRVTFSGPTTTVPVWLVGDSLFEGGETIQFGLANASSTGTTLTGGTLTILNDDVNVLPVASAGNLARGPRKVLAASDLFAVSDGNGDAITQYEFWDGSGGSNTGHFTLNGTEQPAGSGFVVAAANLGQVNFVTGVGGYTDTLWVRAYDGTGWGAWKDWTVAAGNAAPVASAPDVVLGYGRNVAISSFFNVTDAQSDTITQYRFWDGTAAGYSASILVDGVAQATGRNIDVAAADLSKVTIQAAAGVINDQMWVQAFDGMAWGAWEEFIVQSRNTAPVAMANAAVQYSGWGKTIAASTLFGVSDADSHAITSYEFWDGSASAHTGAFFVNGVQQAANTGIVVAGANLGQVTFRTATEQVSEILYVRAHDGFAWSNWAQWTQVQSNNAPVVTVTDHPVVGAAKTLQASGLFGVNDAQGDAILVYQFMDDTVGNGAFSLNGVVQAADTTIQVNAAQLGQLTFLTGMAGTSDLLWVRALDGFAWGEWKSFTVTANNTAPALTGHTTKMLVGAEVAAAALFAATDAQGDAIATYQFWDDVGTAGSAGFLRAGVLQGAGTTIGVAAADLGTIAVRANAAGGSTDALWLRVHDGLVFSDWVNFAVQTVAGNTLTGTAGADLLVGNAGANLLDGGAGNDTLVGGAEADWFITGQGHDTIADFGSGDVIDLTAVAGLDTFAQLLAMASQQGADAVFDLGGGNGLTLTNTNIAELSEFAFQL